MQILWSKKSRLTDCSLKIVPCQVDINNSMLNSRITDQIRQRERFLGARGIRHDKQISIMLNAERQEILGATSFACEHL